MSTESPRGARRGMRDVGTALIAALVIAAGFYLLGRVPAMRAAADAKAELAAERAAMVQQIAVSDQRLLVAGNRSNLVEARGLLYQAAIDLEQRNFGIANDRLKSAGALLAAITEETPGLDMTAIRTLDAAIAATSLSVGSNLQQQRERVLDFTVQLTAIIPPAPLP